MHVITNFLLLIQFIKWLIIDMIRYLLLNTNADWWSMELVFDTYKIQTAIHDIDIVQFIYVFVINDSMLPFCLFYKLNGFYWNLKSTLD